MDINFFVPGIPAPGGSKRGFLNRRTGRVQIVDDCKRNKDWRSSVALFASQAYRGQPITDPLVVTVVFYMPRPKGHYGAGKNSKIIKNSAPKFPTKKPDATKLWRSTEDALTEIIWKDDAQIIGQIIEKRYADDNPPGAAIRIQTWIPEQNTERQMDLSHWATEQYGGKA